MKAVSKSIISGIACLAFSTSLSWANTHYVDINNATPAAPYTTWTTAANDIQSAVNAAVSNDTVLVADGTYDITSEIRINKSLTVESVNGPDVTIIDAGGNCRVFSLDSRKGPVALEGLTITGGFSTGQGGGVYCQSTNPILDHCIIRDNVGRNGGGIFQGTVWNSVISGNTASGLGGGVSRGILYNCVVSDNESGWIGGGLLHCTAYNCTIAGNETVALGSGIFHGTAYNCIIWYNQAKETHQVSMFNTCSPEALHGVDGNITNAPALASLSHLGLVSPCYGAGNVAYAIGTDIDGESWVNPPSMGCDEPVDPDSLSGAIQVALREGSRGVANGQLLPLVGNILGPASMHVWDFGDGIYTTNNLSPQHAWSAPGTYSVVLTAYNASNPNGVSVSRIILVVDTPDVPDIHVVASGNDANDGLSWATAKASIQAGVDAQMFEAGRVWVGSGTYAVTNVIEVNRGLTVEAIDGPATTIVDGGGITHCIDLRDGALFSGFSVRNGLAGIRCGYEDATVENCMVYNNQVGGIYGGFVYSCVISNNLLLGVNDSTIYDSIVVNNSARFGAGIDLVFNCCGMPAAAAYNCIVSENTSQENGAGILGGEAYNCLVTGNYATNHGGGLCDTLAVNCTVVGNAAGISGGGTCRTESPFPSGDLSGIVYHNTAPEYPNMQNPAAASNSCSPSLVQGIKGNINADPLFLNPAAGDYRLSATSPCINWGNNNYVLSSGDLDGNPRTVEDYVDMGCYEYQGLLGLSDSDGDGLPDDWEHLYLGGNADPNRDDDGDDHDNWCEWVTGMDPSSAESVFAITNASPTGSFVLEWPSVTGRWYNVFWTPSLTNDYQSLEDFIEHPQNSYTDTTHAAESSGFYKVEARMK